MHSLENNAHQLLSDTIFARVSEYSIGGISLPTAPIVSATNVLLNSSKDTVGIGQQLLAQQSQKIDTSFQYGAISTPTVEAVANSVATLEGGDGALLTPSGQSSIFLVIFTLSRRGGTLLVSDYLTYSTLQLLTTLSSYLGFRIKRLGVRTISEVSINELVADSTFCVLLEAPGGFDYEIPDIEKVFKVSKQARITCVFDNTWSSSVFFRPIGWGADVVVLSLSKCYGGAAGVSLGAIVTHDKQLELKFRKNSAVLGLNVSPERAERVSICLSTLKIRAVVQDASTRLLLSDIETSHPKTKFLHPSLTSHPSHTTWKKYFCGACSVFTICFPDVSTKELASGMDKSVLFRPAYGWGGNSSSYYIFDPRQWRLRSNNSFSAASCIRIYIGLEDWQDLAKDLNSTLLSIGPSDGSIV